MKFLKSLHYTPPLMSVSINSSAQWPAQEAIIADEAMDQIADKVFHKVQSFVGQHDLSTAKFSDELSHIKMDANLAQAFSALTAHSLGVKSVVLHSEVQEDSPIETCVTMTFVTDPKDAKGVQSIALMVSWAASHGMVV